MVNNSLTTKRAPAGSRANLKAETHGSERDGWLAESSCGAHGAVSVVRRFENDRKIEPTLGEALMTKTLTALVAATILATASAAVPTTAQERCIGCGIGGVEYPIAPPGYVYYPAYYEPLPGPNCY